MAEAAPDLAAHCKADTPHLGGQAASCQAYLCFQVRGCTSMYRIPMTSHPHIEARFSLFPGVSEFTFPQQNGHFDRKKLMFRDRKDLLCGVCSCMPCKGLLLMLKIACPYTARVHSGRRVISIYVSCARMSFSHNDCMLM